VAPFVTTDAYPSRYNQFMKSSKFLFFSLIITITWTCDVKNQNDEKSINAEYQEFDDFFQNIENFSGNVLVALDGKSIYEKCFGYASRELLVQNTLETKFRIGSISKPVTAIAVMILAEDGLINVHEKLSTYFFDLPVSWKDITVHQLLTHTSGLAYGPDPAETMHHTTIEEIFQMYQQLPLVEEPGAAFHYSNIGYFVLSILIEKISKMPYDSFVQEAIFKKLRMLNSGADHPHEILLHRAAGYEVNADGVVENAGFDDMLMNRGAGNLYSTVDDLLKLDRAFSTNTLLTKETLSMMITPYTTDTDIGPEVQYGYGLDIVRNDSTYMIFHTGGVLGFKSMFYKYPEKGIVIIACANTNTLNRDWRTEFPKLVYNTLSGTDYHKR